MHSNVINITEEKKRTQNTTIRKKRKATSLVCLALKKRSHDERIRALLLCQGHCQCLHWTIPRRPSMRTWSLGQHTWAVAELWSLVESGFQGHCGAQSLVCEVGSVALSHTSTMMCCFGRGLTAVGMLQHRWQPLKQWTPVSLFSLSVNYPDVFCYSDGKLTQDPALHSTNKITSYHL